MCIHFQYNRCGRVHERSRGGRGRTRGETPARPRTRHAAQRRGQRALPHRQLPGRLRQVHWSTHTHTHKYSTSIWSSHNRMMRSVLIVNGYSKFTWNTVQYSCAAAGTRGVARLRPAVHEPRARLHEARALSGRAERLRLGITGMSAILYCSSAVHVHYSRHVHGLLQWSTCTGISTCTVQGSRVHSRPRHMPQSRFSSAVLDFCFWFRYRFRFRMRVAQREQCESADVQRSRASRAARVRQGACVLPAIARRWPEDAQVTRRCAPALMWAVHYVQPFAIDRRPRGHSTYTVRVLYCLLELYYHICYWGTV